MEKQQDEANEAGYLDNDDLGARDVTLESHGSILSLEVVAHERGCEYCGQAPHPAPSLFAQLHCVADTEVWRCG